MFFDHEKWSPAGFVGPKITAIAAFGGCPIYGYNMTRIRRNKKLAFY
jgi:hypothetical protein